MVTRDPADGEFVKVPDSQFKTQRKCHVLFLEYNNQRAWLPAPRSRSTRGGRSSKPRLPKLGQTARMRKSSRVARRSGDRTLQDDEEEKLNSASKSPAESLLIKQLKMDLVGESGTPSRFSRRKELVEVAGKTGNKLLDQLKVDMVVDSVLPTRGKRRAKKDLEQKSAKKTKVAPVDQIPARQKGFAAKVFRRVQSGDITKPEGHNQLLGRIPGLTCI